MGIYVHCHIVINSCFDESLTDVELDLISMHKKMKAITGSNGKQLFQDSCLSVSIDSALNCYRIQSRSSANLYRAQIFFSNYNQQELVNICQLSHADFRVLGFPKTNT